MAHIDTILAQGGNGSDDEKTGAVSTPIYLSTAFRHPGLGESTGFDYSRLASPTRQILEKQLAAIEYADAAFAVSSGMAAIDLLFSTFLNAGDHFVTSDDLYGGSFRYFDDLTKKKCCDLQFVGRHRLYRSETKTGCQNALGLDRNTQQPDDENYRY